MLLNAAANNANALLAMRVYSVSDLNLGTWSMGDPAVSAHINLCMYSYDLLPITGYAITVSSVGGYNLKSGPRNIPYSLTWDDGGAGNLGASGGAALTNGVKKTGLLRANILDSTCTLSGPNARLNLKITQAAMTAALAGTYTGIITILVTPN
ncbi:MAG: hypothetical protein FJX23_08095 [Alphaproteobacteria bacterium]|nr:hypothetical protein [Alphaproteobacteria bacterium]